MAEENRHVTPRKSISNSLLRSTYLRYSPTPELYTNEAQEAFEIPSPYSPSVGRPRAPQTSQRSSETTSSSSLQADEQDETLTEKEEIMSNQDTSHQD